MNAEVVSENQYITNKNFENKKLKKSKLKKYIYTKPFGLFSRLDKCFSCYFLIHRTLRPCLLKS